MCSCTFPPTDTMKINLKSFTKSKLEVELVPIVSIKERIDSGSGEKSCPKLWIRPLAGLMAILMFSTGCIPQQKLVLVQDTAQTAGSSTTYQNSRTTYLLQTGDVLSITVKGVEQELQNSFNAQGGNGNVNFGDPATQYVNGYSVDEAGDVQIPSAGKIKVKGISLDDATELIVKRIANYLRDATVSVKLVSFKITVIGDVKKPGYYYVSNMRATLLEGIGLGGDLTPAANRKRVKVIRQTPQGTVVGIVDLTSASFISSPFYNLQPNDVVYVEPLSGQVPRKNFTPVTLTLGIISGAATIALLVLNLRRGLN
jgi:polysaccharide biosynthesis/export protein